NGVVYDAEETHHPARVLRLQPGTVVHAVDGQGHELTVRVVRIGPRAAEGDIVERAVRAIESPLSLTLAQGIPKGSKLETVIRMATELGVVRVVPLLLERSVARPDREESSHRLLRLLRGDREGAQHARRP